VAGAPITPTGGHCWFMGGEADGIEGVKVAVRQRKKAGADWIKGMASGGNMTPGTNVFAAQFSVEELRAIVAEAHRLEMKVTAHAHGVEGIKVAVEAPVDMIEHCSFQTPAGSVKDDSVILDIARKGIRVSPTIVGALANYRGEPRWDLRAELTKALFAAGCDVLMSTDCGIPNTPHENLAQALQVIDELAGLGPVATLKLATSTSARLLDLDDRGTIAAGQRADLLVVEGDPTEDLSALERVRLVVSAGEVVYRTH
ncbi:MAG: amidohydrolase family protein, partial [Dehalococcoidia bacterium]|nr:amidohydrolase family protein [Dehalococcoidia bacterium]